MKLKQNVVFIHFQPVELYPPAMNIVDFVGGEKKVNLYVITNKKQKTNKLSEYNPPIGVKIFKPATMNGNTFMRYINYGCFYLASLFLLLKLRPTSVLYFETLSSWPALIYKKIFNRHTKIMVHYHEYSGPDEYAKNMVLAKWMHTIEKKMYHSFSWISQTNPARMQIFKNDNQLDFISESVFHIIPNYPPKSWSSCRANDFSKNKVKRLVFVGSLGYKNMYLQEVIDWLAKHGKEFSLDIYSYNIDSKARDLLQKSKLNNIRFCGGCDYQSLPAILNKYNIGLVIYKPFSTNTIQAISNKVFEYLACGLDVWFSQDMVYTLNYIKQETYPKILPVDFGNFMDFNYEKAIDRKNIGHQPSIFFYEEVYPEILKDLLN